jgi:dTMP kinase
MAGPWWAVSLILLHSAWGNISLQHRGNSKGIYLFWQERPMFITFEGIEGSGKSVQIERVEAYLAARGVECVRTREPGGTGFGAAVRTVLLHADGPSREPVAELLLYLADRYQHLHELIEPALQRGATVLSDRYHDATRAYQGAARRIRASLIEELARLLAIREPDRTILLDLEPEIGLHRARSRNRVTGATGEGRFEAEDLPFHRDVRAAYLKLAKSQPERVFVVDASGTPDQVFARIEPLLINWFEFRKAGN